MLDIVGYPNLQDTALLRAHRTAAVDEVLANAANFRDVKMPGDFAAIRQKEP